MPPRDRDEDDRYEADIARILLRLDDLASAQTEEKLARTSIRIHLETMSADIERIRKQIEPDNPRDSYRERMFKVETHLEDCADLADRVAKVEVKLTRGTAVLAAGAALLGFFGEWVRKKVFGIE